MEKLDPGKKSSHLSNLSQKYVPDEELRDTPARLFRKILNALQMNPRKWNIHLRNYLDYVVTNTDREKAKNERITRSGNIKDTYFQKSTLTFNKLLEGLSILEQKKVEVIIRTTDMDGNVIEVSEEIQIVGRDRMQKILASESEQESNKE